MKEKQHLSCCPQLSIHALRGSSDVCASAACAGCFCACANAPPLHLSGLLENSLHGRVVGVHHGHGHPLRASTHAKDGERRPRRATQGAHTEGVKTWRLKPTKGQAEPATARSRLPWAPRGAACPACDSWQVAMQLRKSGQQWRPPPETIVRAPPLRPFRLNFA